MAPSPVQPMSAYGHFGGGNFPFYQAPNGDWMCRYCAESSPTEYREQHSIWSTPSKAPPTESFVRHHLSLCRCYRDQMQYSYYQASPSYPTYMASPAPTHANSQPSWDRQRDYSSGYQVTPSTSAYSSVPQGIPAGRSRSEMDRFTNTRPRSPSRGSDQQIMPSRSEPAD